MSELKKFKQLLIDHGLEVRMIKSGHAGVFKAGVKIYAYACTPKNAHEAIDNNIKDLVRAGHIPPLVYNGKNYKAKNDSK